MGGPIDDGLQDVGTFAHPTTACVTAYHCELHTSTSLLQTPRTIELTSSDALRFYPYVSINKP